MKVTLTSVGEKERGTVLEHDIPDHENYSQVFIILAQLAEEYDRKGITVNSGDIRLVVFRPEKVERVIAAAILENPTEVIEQRERFETSEAQWMMLQALAGVTHPSGYSSVVGVEPGQIRESRLGPISMIYTAIDCPQLDQPKRAGIQIDETGQIEPPVEFVEALPIEMLEAALP